MAAKKAAAKPAAKDETPVETKANTDVRPYNPVPGVVDAPPVYMTSVQVAEEERLIAEFRAGLA